MRSLGHLTAVAIVVALTSTPISGAKPANAGPKAKAPKPPVAKTSSPKPPKAQSPKANGAAKSSAAHGASKAGGKKTSGTTGAASGSRATTTSTTTSTAGWTPTNPVAEKLSSKPNLLARVKTTLPAGTDLNAATAGFKNFGQFVAATNVSNNLGIDFATLKASMTGLDMTGAATGQPTLSLGQSIQKLKPGVDGEAQARHAEQLASQQIANSQ